MAGMLMTPGTRNLSREANRIVVIEVAGGYQPMMHPSQAAGWLGDCRCAATSPTTHLPPLAVVPPSPSRKSGKAQPTATQSTSRNLAAKSCRKPKH